MCKVARKKAFPSRGGVAALKGLPGWFTKRLQCLTLEILRQKVAR